MFSEAVTTSMTLTSHPAYPAALGYVIRLHRDADPAAAHLTGRLEHVASGQTCAFRSGDELVALLAAHAARTPLAARAVEVP